MMKFFAESAIVRAEWQTHITSHQEEWYRWRKSLFAGKSGIGLKNPEPSAGRNVAKTGLTAMTLLALVSSGYGQVPRGSGPGTLATAAASDERGPRSVSVNIEQQSNPLAKMARDLSRQFGIAIAYEEPAWFAAVDLMPLANAPELRNSAPADLARINPGLRAAALGSVNVQATLSYGQDELLAVGELLQDALDDHARRGNPGMFKVVRFGDDGYSVVPTSIRDAQGQWVSTVSPLDARISFPTEKRTLGARSPSLRVLSLRRLVENSRSAGFGNRSHL